VTPAATQDELLAGVAPAPEVATADVVAAVAASGAKVVVIDDDPTGTQAVGGVPVLMAWAVEDLRWALRQPAPVLFVSANTRSLAPADAAARVAEIADALVAAAAAEGVSYVVVSRSDSTLRGHFPLETDVLSDALATAGTPVDGVIVAPAFIDSGRVTVDSVHWARLGDRLVRVGETEFARDRSFGFVASDLREWVAEKTAGRWAAADVARITLADLRDGGVPAVAAILAGLADGRPVVADAASDGDLRVLALAAIERERAGQVFIYRVGPSFVRARGGLGPAPLLTAELLHASGIATGHGLVAAGSHVGQTARQLDRLDALGGVATVELDVRAVIDSARADAELERAVAQAVEELTTHDVVLRTSRELVAGATPAESLSIARTVSAALVAAVRGVVAGGAPAWVVTKGGITSSDVGRHALGIRRATVRGTMLPGIVSLWTPADGEGAPPLVVFPGNVGDDEALADVVQLLRTGA
jgi:uncharacterized protein YgbK (DUF1537 family)